MIGTGYNRLSLEGKARHRGRVRESEDADMVIRQIGRRLAQLRRAKGLTQRKLAEQLNVAVPWISQIETKGSNLEVRTIVRFANALGVSSRDMWDPPEETEE